jgi:type IV secretory pathway TraG/TraD family ATPase VirD4
MNIREDELLVKMPQRPAARLTQYRYYDDPEVRDRAPARGESWIPPLGPVRPDGPLEPPALDDLADDDAADTEAEQTGAKAVTRQAAKSDDADPFDDAATAFLDDLGEPDDAEAFEASVSGR